MSSIKQAAEEMLLQTIIPFWKGLRDEENGGFYGYMDFDLKLDKKAEKGCILNSRILWFFSEAAMLTGRADLAEDARHAYQFFLKNCYDEANGGVYWSRLKFASLIRPATMSSYSRSTIFSRTSIRSSSLVRERSNASRWPFCSASQVSVSFPATASPSIRAALAHSRILFSTRL